MTDNYHQASDEPIQGAQSESKLNNFSQKSELVCPMPTPKTKEETAKSQIARRQAS